MTTQELIEYAALDALGLLESHERDAFETAFKAAPPHVQAHVRREQLRFTTAQASVLPDVEPPAGLRFRVVAAVREAIQKASPLHINREAKRAGTTLPAMIWSSASAWRVASLGLASAVIVLSVISIHLADANDRTQQSQVSSDQAGLYGELATLWGPRSARIMTAPGMQNFTLAAQSESDAAKAGASGRLFLDVDTGDAVLICEPLPVVEGSYRVVVLDDEGNVYRELGQRFASTATRQAIPFEALQLADAKNIAIMGPAVSGGADEVVLAVRFA